MAADSDKHQRLKDLFLTACDTPEAERAALLDRECANDAALRAELETLLKEHSRETPLIPNDPTPPLGSVSSLLSRANISLPSGSIGEETLRRDPTSYLDDSSATPSGSGSGFVDAGRFMAGTIVAGRYRIIELLGRGGMGEVYRADDLALNASIAMKFLPPLFGADVKWLERLKNEVRVARQVTHPNVCRVFDLGEFQGEQFITMEYVDGENLASLLRRIGRVPHDKGVQLARQLCAGLAAAHDRGVLHRDLKPANVMIDGRGAVRITDFGLAAPADQLRAESGGGLRAGTPAYMSPEQLNGKPVGPRSDVYSLGLVLYEMFTGRRCFKADNLRDYQRLHTREDPPPPHEFADDMDPIVERVILRCLEKDPRNRPATAIAVSAGLPGANPLREILAAGETPSPEVVAAAGEATGAMRPRAASGWLVAGLVAVLLMMVFAPRAFLVQQAVVDKPPAVLTDRARTILDTLGYHNDVVRDRVAGFGVDSEFYQHVQNLPRAGERLPMLTRARNGLIYYWYRQSPEYLVPWQSMPLWPSDVVAREEDDPPPAPGGIDVALDPAGRLLSLEVHAGGRDNPEAATHVPLEPTTQLELVWKPLLDAAGVEADHFHAVTPTAALPVYADARAAWEGQFAELPGESFHVEAASANGRAVYFSVMGNYPDERPRLDINHIIQNLLALVLVAVGGVLAYRHYRSGRADRQGAARMGMTFLVFGFLGWALRAHHVPEFIAEFRMFRQAMGTVLYWGALVWIFYLALEPYVRRVWPELVISWNRLLAGKFVDPLVGRDVLIGSATGAVVALLDALDIVAPKWFGLPARIPSINGVLQRLYSLSSPATLFTGPLSAVYFGLLLMLLLVVLRMAFRRKFPAAVGFLLAFLAATGTWNPLQPLGVVLQVLVGILLLGVTVRSGLVALVFCLTVRHLLLDFPITNDWSVWYATSSLLALGVVAALLLVSFYAAIGGKSLISVTVGNRR